MKRGPLGAALVLLILAAGAGGAAAAPSLITTRPAPAPETGDFAFFVGGIDENGRSLKASSIELVLDGVRAGAPSSVQPLSEWATVASEGSPTWRPPVAVGLVYLWVNGVPSGVLDGIHAFFQRVPSRTPVYPTVYGRMRQGRARLTAADISRLDEVPNLEGYRPNLIEAIRLDFADLAAEKVPIKLLLVITDGRDFADPKGDGPGDFSALGRELRKAGITPLVVGFPAPDADAVQSASNLRDLQAAAGGFLRMLEQPEDLENTLESLGQGIADLQRVRFSGPVSWGVTGGTHRVGLRLTTATGQRLNADPGSLEVAAGKILWIILGSVLALALVVVVVVVIARRSGGREIVDDDSVLAAAHDLIRRGAPPQRAVEELTRMYPEAVRSLVHMDPESLNDPQYPYFRTRPGRMRMQEMRDLLANKGASSSDVSPVVAEVLAAAVAERSPPAEVAETMAARTTADEWTAFAGLSLEQLAEALRSVARAHPVLGTPRARGMAVAIQDALRARGAERGIAVGWLVRARGPGRRGQTLRLADGRCVIGTGPAAELRLGDDPSVTPEHAEVTGRAGEFAVRPLGGPVTVEGVAIGQNHVLSDGETIGIGAGLFVFKSATAGNLLSRSKETSAPVRRRSTRGRKG